MMMALLLGQAHRLLRVDKYPASEPVERHAFALPMESPSLEESTGYVNYRRQPDAGIGKVNY